MFVPFVGIIVIKHVIKNCKYIQYSSIVLNINGSSARILEQSMKAKNLVGIGLSY
jgi:hypothetical protein